MFAATVVMVALALVACSAPVAGASPINARQGRFRGQIGIGGGRKLYLRCAGRGRPTVIMESGIHDSSDPWTMTATAPPVPSSPSVFAGVARFTHVCIYDRPGTIRYTQPPALTMRSTPVSMPRRLPSMARDLHRLLMAAGLRAPVVIVAHSFGGLIDRYFAQTYRHEVLGMVLVDAFDPSIRRLFGRLWPRYRHLLNFPGTPLESQPGWETIDVDSALRDVQRAKPMPRMPLAVISKTEPFSLQPGFPRAIARRLEHVWPHTQQRMVSLQPQTPHIFATGSNHYVQLHDPDLVTSVIRLIFDRVRHHDRRQR
jgi:pimeloyl-ACP methyl ester carboxylesterase